MEFIAVLIGFLFLADNKEFFDTVEKQRAEGYTWHYVGETPLDPNAKSIPLQVEGEDPYILWKLKK